MGGAVGPHHPKEGGGQAAPAQQGRGWEAAPPDDPTTRWWTLFRKQNHKKKTPPEKGAEAKLNPCAMPHIERHRPMQVAMSRLLGECVCVCCVRVCGKLFLLFSSVDCGTWGLQDTTWTSMTVNVREAFCVYAGGAWGAVGVAVLKRA